MKKILSILFLTIILSGCGDPKDLVNKAGTKVGGTMTNFVKGVGKGIDQQLEVNVELSKELLT